MKLVDRLFILSSGLAGGLLVLAAALHYGTGSLGGIICALIAVGLACGIWELFRRESFARGILEEVARLPRPAADDTVAGVSSPLRRMFEAQLGGQRSAPQVGFAPFLIGVLVTLGLLGTFLGLVEALQGARTALAGSGEVDALRTGLAAPMSGLTLAFGTSVAGIGASLALGLATVFVRRIESRASAEVTAYVAGPLSRFAPGQRELGLLQELVHELSATRTAHGDALPRAAESLAAVEESLSTRLGEVTSGLSSFASKVTSDLAAAQQRSATDITLAQKEFLASQQAAANSLQSRLLAQLEELTATHRDSTRQQSQNLADHLDRMASQQKERSETQSARLTAQLETLASSQERWSDKLATLHRDLAETHSSRLTAQLDGLFAHQKEHSEDLSSRLTAQLEGLASQQESWSDEQASRLTAQLEGLASQQESWSDEQTSRLTAQLKGLASQQVEWSEGQTSRLTAQLEGLASQQESWSDEQTSRLTAQLEGLASQQEAWSEGQTSRLTAQLEGLASKQKEWSEGQSSRMVQQVERLASLQDSWLGGLEARLGNWIEGVSSQAERDSEERRAREQAWFELADTREKGWLDAMARREEGWLAATETRDETFKQALEAREENWHQRLGLVADKLAAVATDTQVATGELGAAASGFAATLVQYHEAAGRWTESMERLESALEDTASRDAEQVLGEYVDRMREVMGESMQVVGELFAEVRALRHGAEVPPGAESTEPAIASA